MEIHKEGEGKERKEERKKERKKEGGKEREDGRMQWI